MWVILILDQVFWSILMPPVALTAWTVMKLCTFLCVQAGLISETPCWLDTPFDLLAYWYLLAHGVHVRDEAPAGGIAVPSPILLPGIQSFRGAVLMNHRSFGTPNLPNRYSCNYIYVREPRSTCRPLETARTHRV